MFFLSFFLSYFFGPAHRDVECVRTYFRKRYGYQCDDYPRFSDIEKGKYMLDQQVGCEKEKDVD